MKKRIALLCMVCGVLVLSGCGGGASSSRTNDLESRVNTSEALVVELRRSLELAETRAKTAETMAEAEKSTAEAAIIRAELAEAETKAAKDARATAEAEAKTAKAAQAVAEAAQETAETERDDALKRATAAESARDTALAAQQSEQQRREQAEADRAALERVTNQADARLALAGNFAVGTGLTGVTARYNEAAIVTAPALSQARSTTGSAGRWFTTTVTSRDQTNADTVKIYSDVNRPGSVPFKDSVLNVGTGGGKPPVNSEGNLSWNRDRLYDLGLDSGVSSMDAASGSFPPNGRRYEKEF